MCPPLPRRGWLCESRRMSGTDGKERRRGPMPLAELVGKVVDPVIARRGFATADLIAAWPAIVGQAFAACTQPERIVWPHVREGAAPAAGTLFLRIDGPRAIFLQHELPQIRERINALLGFAAIGQIRISQGPVQTRIRPSEPPSTALSPDGEAALASAIDSVADESLRAALDRLGRGVLSARNNRT